MNKPTLMLFLHVRSSSCLTFLVTLHWTRTRMSISFLPWGAPYLTPYSKYSLTSVEYRERIPFLALLAALLFLHPRRQLDASTGRLHCWLLFSLWSYRTSGPLVQSSFPSQVAPSLSCGIGYYMPHTGLRVCPELPEVTLDNNMRLSFLQPVEAPLKNSPALQLINHCPLFHVTHNLPEIALYPIIQVL